VSKKTGVDIQGTNVWHPFDSTKVLVHGKRMEAIVNEQYLPPVVLNLDVSGECQYHCPHCHHRRKQVRNAKLEDLPLKLARTLPYFLQNWEEKGERVKACCIVGSQGDALLYEHLPMLLKELFFSGIETGLVSNGYGYDDMLLEYAAFYSKFIGFSMDAGTSKGYKAVKNCPEDAWTKVLNNIEKLTSIIHNNRLRNDVGWKILVLPQTYKEIYASCRLARETGCRYVQIRPADLPEEQRELINIPCVEEQIEQAIQDFEEPGKFEIVGIRHKFTPDFKRVLPKYCYLTPLTVTVTSDGKVYPCVDRRCDNVTLLANCKTGGWQALKEAWGSSHHLRIVNNALNCYGQGPQCRIRCSNYGYDKYFANYFVQDNMDRNLI